MIYSVAKNRNKNHITFGLLILLFVIIAGGIYSSLPIIKDVEVYKNYVSNREVTFTSKRARFSFEHPNWWPVTPASDEQLKQNNLTYKNYKEVPKDNIEIESLDFDKEWNRAAGGSRLGFMNVIKIKGVTNLEDYIRTIDKETVVDAPGTYFKVPAPKIDRITVAGEPAISVNEVSSISTFTSNASDIVIVKDGLVYRFVLGEGSGFTEYQDKKSQTFRDIISSVKFLN